MCAPTAGNEIGSDSYDPSIDGAVRAGAAWREKVSDFNVENLDEVFNLNVGRDRASGLNVRQDAACHVAAEDLQLSHEIVLRPIVLVA